MNNSPQTEILVLEPQALVKQSLFDLGPAAMVKNATEMANALADVIEQQKLYTLISGKKYVRVEGWQTLGVMLGILPREKEVVENDGEFTAQVDLIRAGDGRVVGGASSICGTSEKMWAGRERYARRSMAVTRATGKAFRLAFSWIMTLAGYEPTPAEEMPFEPTQEKQTSKPQAKLSSTSGTSYSNTSTPDKNWLLKEMQARNVEEAQYKAIAEAMVGNPKTGPALDAVILTCAAFAPKDSGSIFNRS